MTVWIIFNEYREIMGVFNNKEIAEQMKKEYNEMAVASIFTMEEHEVENKL